MYKINEQEDPWADADAAIQQATKSKSTSTGKITTPPKSGGDADAAKRAKDAAALKAKQDVDVKDKDIVKQKKVKSVFDRKISAGVNPFSEAVSKSINFFIQFGPASKSLNSDYMLKLIYNYIIQEQAGVMKTSCIYIDWILRLSTPGTPPYNLAMKHQKQYNYVLSHNGKLSNSLQLIKGIPKNPTLKNLNSIFNPAGPIGQSLNMGVNPESTEEADQAEIKIIRMRHSLDGLIKFNSDFTESTFIAQRSAEEFHKIIMSLYTQEVYNSAGKMLPKFKTKF
jgi:hypothetical protein